MTFDPTTAITPEPWMTDALCRQVDPDLHYPERGRIGQQHAAKECCAGCPVRLKCLDYALRAERGLPLQHRFGVWAGLMPHERAKLDRKSAA